MSYNGKRKTYRPWTLVLTPVFLVAALIAGFFRGTGFAVLAFCCLALASALYGILCLLCRNARWGGAARVVRQVIHALAALWLVSFFVVEGLIISGAHSDPEQSVDCVLVLGAGLHGETPSYALAARLDEAAEFLARWPETPVVVSGGQGQGETITEAEAMTRYLTARGIDPARIIREDRSTTTQENVDFSLPLMPSGTARVAVVSNDFHLYRARILLRRAGVEPLALAAPTPIWYLRLTYYFREYFSVVFMGLG